MKSTFDKYIEGKKELLNKKWYLWNKTKSGKKLEDGTYTTCGEEVKEFLEQIARESRDIGYKEAEVIKLETLREVIKIVNECPPFDGCQSKDWIRDKVVMEYKKITGIDIPKKKAKKQKEGK